jgi:hypothetical protein
MARICRYLLRAFKIAQSFLDATNSWQGFSAILNVIRLYGQCGMEAKFCGRSQLAKPSVRRHKLSAWIRPCLTGVADLKQSFANNLNLQSLRLAKKKDRRHECIVLEREPIARIVNLNRDLHLHAVARIGFPGSAPGF